MTTGHVKFLEQLRADGIQYVFGNPGSSEEGLLDAISNFPDIHYILGLQEAAIVCLADGYAQATKKPAIVQLHSGVGLGSALGSIYHALRRQTPMVVIAGEAGFAYEALDAHMAVDLVAMARPVTKYAERVGHPGSLLRLLRRCIKIASTPPWGPVFLALPQDILDQRNDEHIMPTLVPETRFLPEPALLAQATELLEDAENPIIIMGDGVSHANAHKELSDLAEILGARVWGGMVSELVLPWTHPLYCGLTGHMFGHDSVKIVSDADTVIICGTYVFPEVFPLLTSPFRSDAKIIHIDLDAFAIAKNHPITLGLIGNPKLTLKALANMLDDRMTVEQKTAAKLRIETIGNLNAKVHAEAQAKDRLHADNVPLHMSAFAEVLARHLPEDAIIFDESLTHSVELTRWVTPVKAGCFFQTPGGTLGVGIPGAIGVKLAQPERTVVGFTGDGGALYTFQALWTAAHYQIDAKFIVCNNHSYRLLKINILSYWEEHKPAIGHYPPSFDLGNPNIDYIGLAHALGVPGQRVTHPEEIEPAICAMLNHDGAYLIELILDGSVPLMHVTPPIKD